MIADGPRPKEDTTAESLPSLEPLTRPPRSPDDEQDWDDEDVERAEQALGRVWPTPVSTASPGFWATPERIGPFRIVREIGRGGCGIVFLADHPALGRVALKVPRLEVLVRPAEMRRFVREGKAVERLEHANLVKVLEVGEADSVGYIASEYVEGSNLRTWLTSNGGRAPERLAARLMATLARAIAHAHARGVLHRDLKPDNVLLKELGPDHGGGPDALPFEPLVCDFGLAWLMDIEDVHSSTHLLAGAPPYIAPESILGPRSSIGEATDVYGLGAILYELLTGRPPFDEGRSVLATLRAVTDKEPVPLRRIRHGLPRDLEIICLKCLEKHPDRRYPSALALAEDLERFLAGRPIRARGAFLWYRACRCTRRHALTGGLVGLGLLSGATLTRLLLRPDSRRDPSRDLATRMEVNRLFPVLHRDCENARVLWVQEQLREAKQKLPEITGHSFAWNYLNRLSSREQKVLGRVERLEHESRFSPEGRILQLGDVLGELTFFDTTTGESRRADRSIGGHLVRSAFSPDSRWVVSIAEGARPGNARLYEIATGHCRFDFADRALVAASFSADGRFLTTVSGRDPRAQADAAWSPTLEYWSVSPDGQVAPLSSGSESPVPLSVRSSLLDLVAALLSERTTESARDPVRKQVLGHPSHHFAGIRGVDGHRHFVIGTGRGSFEVVTREGYPIAECIVLDGQALVHDDVYLRSRPWTLPGQVAEHAPLVDRLCGVTPPPGVRVRRFRAENGDFHLSRDGRKAISDFGLSIVDISDQGRKSTLLMSEPQLLARFGPFSPDSGHVSITRNDGTVELVGIAGPPAVRRLRGHFPCETWALAFRPDGEVLASGGDDHAIRLWDVNTGARLGMLKGHTSLVCALAWSPDGLSLISGSFDQTIRVWDVDAGKARATFHEPKGKVRAVAVSPDGTIVAAMDTSSTIGLWDLRTGRHRARSLDEQGGSATDAVAFTPDGESLVVPINTGHLRIYDLASGDARELDTRGGVAPLACRPGTTEIAVGYLDGRIRLWDPAAGSRSRLLDSSGERILALAFTPDGKNLASGRLDGSVSVWDPDTGQEVLRFADTKAQVNAVSFSPDGEVLAAADHTGAIRLWRADRP